jgi:arginyl-tRNA--protein-N-Asp/Glu arginylyltransferase
MFLHRARPAAQVSAEDPSGTAGPPSQADPEQPGRARLQALLAALGLEPSPAAPCPYLSGRESRIVVVRPQRLGAKLYRVFLDLNFRRLGGLVYRPECADCTECRQLRVRALEFRPSRAQRRCGRLNRDVSADTGVPEATPEKHAIYQRYLQARHDGQMNGSWQEFVESVYAGGPFTREVVFRVGGRMLGAGIYDVTPQALSAVYFYFDPELARRSPGVLNVLWLLGLCRSLAVPWLYLGYYVAGSHTMSYKKAFRPNETLGDEGRWR